MLKRIAFVLLVGLALSGCDDDSPTEPADPNVVVFTAQLSPTNEVPPVTGPDSTGRGDVTITMRVQRDASNNITGSTFDFVVNLNSFPANTNWILAHIHEGAPGVAGPVRVNTGLVNTSPIVLTNGSVTNHRFTGIPFGPNERADFATHIQQLIVNPNGYYFNVHTSLNTGGAVRGPLVVQ